MEWIHISPNKLKIMLTAEDAKHYALDCKDANYAELATRAAFRDILADVRKKSGFDACEEKTYIQMYPSKEGGCELFITKIGLLLSEDEAPMPSNTPRRKRGQTGKALRFPELAPLLSLCRRLRGDARVLKSTAWKDLCGRWWLLLFSEGELPFVCEYGECKSITTAQLYLAEHGKPICKERAIETLGLL